MDGHRCDRRHGPRWRSRHGATRLCEKPCARDSRCGAARGSSCALAAYMEHHAAAVALIGRIQVAVANHDLAPEPEAISWGAVGSMEKTRQDLQALSDWLFDEGEYAA